MKYFSALLLAFLLIVSGCESNKSKSKPEENCVEPQNP